ncbi:serine hydrolase [Roseomonas sp. SSH11]|uniref:Serine hydrolase n=1 Tax=Pararoseomonas baculiformis TaxID=2820812 RepID=A0ABS4AH82_9PROT|nr:serine hydrolase [Pararoseomonas baculiformis]MBP0446360.1 serine hydrolase [Pararoseomonas baculiformis]
MNRLPRRPLLGLALVALARPVRAAPLDAVLAEAAGLPRLYSVTLAREGRVLAERRFRGPGLDVPQNIKSASKTVVSALVGCAISRGVLRGVDQPVLPLLGGRMAGLDPRAERITIGHLLTMRAGLERTSGVNYSGWAAARDPVAYALARPFVDEPGGGMQYSTGSTHMLGAALSRAAGRSLLELARDWLGEPLGISIPPWPRDPQGRYYGGNDMRLTPRALLRLGECYRLGGLWDGARVIPAGWIAESWVPRTRSSWSGQLYGYGWWIGEARGMPVYFAWGYGGQMLYLVPEMGLSVVMLSDPAAPRDPVHMASLHALLAEGIMPALGAPGGAGTEPLRVPEPGAG